MTTRISIYTQKTPLGLSTSQSTHCLSSGIENIYRFLPNPNPSPSQEITFAEVRKYNLLPESLIKHIFELATDGL